MHFLYRNLYSTAMVILSASARTISVTDAAARGVAGLIKDAEAGADIIVSRRGKPAAAVVSTRRLEELRTLEADLRDAAAGFPRRETMMSAPASASLIRPATPRAAASVTEIVRAEAERMTMAV